MSMERRHKHGAVFFLSRVINMDINGNKESITKHRKDGFYIMVMFVTLTFEDKDIKERRLFEEMSKELKTLEKKVNRKDFKVFCVNRYDECVMYDEYYLKKGLYGEICIEGDDIYKEAVMNRIEGTKHFVNWLLW